MSFLFDGSVFKLNSYPQSETGGHKIGRLVFDLPGEKVNKLGKDVLIEFTRFLDLFEASLRSSRPESKYEALVLVSGKEGNFIAGADIELILAAKNEQDAFELSRSGQKLLDRWEDLPLPKVCAVNGAALGGGCEFSLASSAIVMSNSSTAKIGVPEVMLGVIPGMGGCVRMPRKIGLASSLDLILTGRTLNGERAVKMGLVEACLPKENFEAHVVQWTVRNLEKLKKGDRLAKEPKLAGMGGPVGALMEKTPVGRMVVFKKAREGVMSKSKGHYPAPLEALDVLQESGASYGPKLSGTDRTHALEREAKGFGKCASTQVSKNLIKLFFLTEAVKKSKGVPEYKGVEKKIDSIGVLGAGVMGGGIAQLGADKAFRVRMKDLNLQSLTLGMQAASKIFSKQVRSKRISKREYLQKLNLISPTLEYEGFRGVDFVVEAIVENMDIKKKALQELETKVTDSCVIASNTSSLSISEMQKALTKPDRFGGMHFFNPVAKMPLIEVIRGEKTSDETVVAIYQLAKKMGKTPIVVKDAPGFLVNRLLGPYLNEGVWMVSEGVSIEKLDAALLNFGMPMGPMELIDEVGVDVAEKVAHILHEGLGDRMKPAPLNAALLKEGKLGKKSGAGLYVYEADGKGKRFDESVYDVLGVKPDKSKHDAQAEWVDRCILTMVNEASRCLEEKIVDSAQEVDLGMIMGTGFPPFRGGLLRHADTIGLKEVVVRLKKFEVQFGKRFEPAAILVKLAEEGKTFYEAFA